MGPSFMRAMSSVLGIPALVAVLLSACERPTEPAASMPGEPLFALKDSAIVQTPDNVTISRDAFKVCKIGPEDGYTAEFEVVETMYPHIRARRKVSTDTVTIQAGKCKVVQYAPDDPIVKVTELLTDDEVAVEYIDVRVQGRIKECAARRCPWKPFSKSYRVDDTNSVEEIIGHLAGAGFPKYDDLGAVAIFKNKRVELPCQECKGGVTKLTLRNTGAAAQVVVATDDNLSKLKPDEKLFEGNVAANGTFTLTGTGKDGKLPKDVYLFVDGRLVAKIHLSCSKPIGPGMLVGAFKVVEAFSKDNGRICKVGAGGSLCDDGKPQTLTFQLQRESKVTNQQEGKAQVLEGGSIPAGVSQVRVETTDSKVTVQGSGAVAVGGEVTLAGADRFPSQTTVKIFDGNTLLQTVTFHTSCSKPLVVGDQFGSLLLKGFTLKP